MHPVRPEAPDRAAGRNPWVGICEHLTAALRG
jgi:hypothetical protein